MSDFKKLCDLVTAEINKEVAKGSLSPDTIRTIGAGIDVLKDIKEMERDDKMEEQGYSEHYPNRGWNIMPYYAYDDMSMASYAPRRRDDMGRFMRSRDSYDGSYDEMYDGRSNRRGYSRDAKIEQLEDMMNHAKNDAERESIRKLIVQMENG